MTIIIISEKSMIAIDASMLSGVGNIRCPV